MTQPDSARLTDAEIAAYRELSEQATAGPWGREKAAERMGGWEIAPLDSEGECDWSREVCATASNDDANSAFIAASRTIGPALAEEVLDWRAADMRWNVGHKFAELYCDLAMWSDQTFGAIDTRGPLPALHHLKREVDEAIAQPGGLEGLEEYADCLMILLDASRRAGFRLEQVVIAARHKLERNRQREWAEPDEDGVIEHVREQEAPHD